MATASEPSARDDRGAIATADADVAVEAAERVLLAGASGGTGRRALRRLAASPLVTRALTSSSAKTDDLTARGADEVVVGDLLAPADAERAVEACDVVISAVGSTPREIYGGGSLVDGEGTENLVTAASAARTRTFVMVSAIGVGPERPGPMGRLFRLTTGPTIRAKERAEAAIRASGLRYTILRPGLLVPDRLAGRVVAADAGAGLWGPLARDDLARLAVSAPFTPAAADRTLEVVRNPLLAGRGESIEWRPP